MWKTIGDHLSHPIWVGSLQWIWKVIVGLEWFKWGKGVQGYTTPSLDNGMISGYARSNRGAIPDFAIGPVDDR
jgi:hypothetical protein